MAQTQTCAEDISGTDREGVGHSRISHDSIDLVIDGGGTEKSYWKDVGGDDAGVDGRRGDDVGEERMNIMLT